MTASTIMLANQGHTENLGDQAIDHVLTRFLELRGFAVQHIPFDDGVENKIAMSVDSHDYLPRIAMRVHPLMDYWNTRRVQQYFEACPTPKALVIGGGELLANHEGFASSMLALCREMHRRKVPILIVGVSGGVVGKLMSKRYSEALHYCSYISVRDHATERLLMDQYGIRASYAPDVVFSFNKIFEMPEHHGDVDLCIPVPFDESMRKTLHVSDDSEYIKYIATMLGREQTDRPVVCTSTAAADMKTVKNVAAAMSKYLNRPVKVEPYRGLEDFIKLLSHASNVVSGRMHACILGLEIGCNVQPIPYREKLITFSREYDNSMHLAEVEKLSFDGLEKLAATLSNIID